jgi:carboxylate-amine ligase
MLDQLIEDIAEDADALGCLPELRRCRTIVGAGTSADTQLTVFEAHGRTGSPAVALQAVTDWIAAATLQ